MALPRALYHFWRELILDTHLGGTYLAIFLLLAIWVLGFGVLGLAFQSTTIVVIWTILVVAFLIGTIIEIQYQIYRDEVNRTFDELKRKKDYDI